MPFKNILATWNQLASCHSLVSAESTVLKLYQQCLEAGRSLLEFKVYIASTRPSSKIFNNASLLW